MYYLKDSVDRGKLMVALERYIFSDGTMKDADRKQVTSAKNKQANSGKIVGVIVVS